MGPPAEGQDKVRLTQGSAAWSMLGAGFGQNLACTYDELHCAAGSFPMTPSVRHGSKSVGQATDHPQQQLSSIRLVLEEGHVDNI